jgi:tripartite-type tricarboxylate transporter receptor subunit TctC
LTTAISRRLRHPYRAKRNADIVSLSGERTMKFPRRKFLSLAGAVATAPVLSRVAAALDYPTRPITVVVPFPAGGPVDTLARLLAEPMGKALGQPLVVENAGGAGGTIGDARVARATPDGYTVVLGNWTTHVGSPAAYPLDFDAVADFAPVALLAFSPLIVVGRKGLPPNTVQELITYLKANPGKVTSGTVGLASPSQVGALSFQKLTGTQFQLVPYRGAAPALTDLLGGQIDLRFGAEASQMLPYLPTSAVKAFAILGDNRWFKTPDVPTMAEAGVPGLALTFWQALWAPKATPEDVIAKLNAAAVAALADASVRQHLHDLGEEIPPRERQTPQALGAFHKAEIAKWWPIIKAAGIKAE